MAAAMKITLLDHTQNPEKAIGLAGRLCYYEGTSADLSVDDDFDYYGMVLKLKKMGHMTPFEQATFNFGIDKISRVCSHQLVRHRVASFNQQSQRYVAYNHLNVGDFYYPIIKDADEDYDEDLCCMLDIAYENAIFSYNEILKYLINDYGLTEKAAAENARYVLPNAMHTNLVMSMNARELFHFFELRCCNRAQEEIKDLAWCIKHILTEKFPTIFENCGPNCITSKCKEGKLSCGRPYQTSLPNM
jgi:thymidylate synthase (FAD)